jgi:hypothetical protein
MRTGVIEGWKRSHPYCRYRGDSHPTATFFHTYQPEKREKNIMTGISARHTNSGIS